MIEKTSSFSRFLLVAAAFVIVVSGLKMAGPTVGAFFTRRFHSYDRLALASLA